MQEILAAQGFGAERLALIYGGMDPKDREAVKAAFQADPSESPVQNPIGDRRSVGRH